MRKAYYSRKRRAIMRQGEEIIHLVVFERDEWICHLCKKLIDRKLRGDHWWRATLDHVIPLSKGGTHTYDNTAAAHWICNMRKGDSLPGELTLSPPGDTMMA